MKRRLAATFLIAGSLAHAQNAPTPYCTSGTSTIGCQATISANVQPNPQSTAGCVITVSGVDGVRNGLCFYGLDNTGFTPSPWGLGGSSFLCVRAPAQRLGPVLNSLGTPGLCDGSLVIDWDAWQLAHPAALGNPWSPGQRVFVQAWYRDPLAPMSSTLSNALELAMASPWPIPCVSVLPGMVAIPSGSFLMGSDAPYATPYYNTTAEQPVHAVTLSYCFWMGATEVTQAQYLQLTGLAPSYFAGPNMPVSRVNWYDARAYCALLTAQQAAVGGVPPGYEYRLPTEAEWEYACRAGSTTEYGLGATIDCSTARVGFSWHTGISCTVVPSPVDVASFAPNAWGLYDMHGNVSEWCLDSRDPYSAAPATDPFVTGSFFRVTRGGNAGATSDLCRSASRGAGGPALAINSIGFRVVLAPILSP